jgi:hypothetical protein
MRIVSLINDVQIIERILRHVGMWVARHTTTAESTVTSRNCSAAMAKVANEPVSASRCYNKCMDPLLPIGLVERPPATLENRSPINNPHADGSMATILCMKWGKKYGPEYVNRLHSMTSRHLTLPHRFVCLTDDRTGLNAGIETFPIPSLELPAGAPERGWTKLVSFSPALTAPGGPELQGDVLFLDLDIVIVGNMDSFFEQPGDFLIIRDWQKGDYTGNSSVYRWRAGTYPDVLEYFRANLDAVRKRHRNEQEFLTAHLTAQGKVSYWPVTWCRSFKKHCVKAFPFSLWQPPEVPAAAKVIVFHGLPNPPDALVGRSGKWYRRVLPTPWIAENWN